MRILSFTILLILSLSSNVSGQRYALLDRGWKRPVQYTDTITKAQLKDGWFPIYNSEMDSLLSIVGEFKKLFKAGMSREYFNQYDYGTDHIEVSISNVKMAYGDRYDIDLTSTIETVKATLKLSNSNIPNRENQQNIKEFYAYIDNALHARQK